MTDTHDEWREINAFPTDGVPAPAPEVVLEVPVSWSPRQIRAWERELEDLAAKYGRERVRLKVVTGG